MARTIETDVLVVGAGPVGLTLAIDLAGRGVDVTLVELRPRGARPEPKCNHVSARSMEIFRRLGLAKALREAGLPEDYPNDISYRTSFTGREITRIPIPCRRDRYRRKDGPDGWWPTPEPPHRINQIYLEPILFGHAAAMARIRILNRTEISEVGQDHHGVSATARDLDTGETIAIRAAYLAGCDGGRSLVRKAIGATLTGDAMIQRVQSTFIRAPELIGLQQHGNAWATFSLNPRRAGNVYAIDGRETWLVHNYLTPGETDFDAVDRDWAIRAILGVGAAFDYQVISREDWIGRRLVADRFRDRRLFIAGDAAHIWVPYGGYGMNAGIADAAGLAWLLAARLAGWAPPGILDAYQRERLPITTQVSRFAMDHAHKEIRNRSGVPDNIEADDPAGAAARVALGQATYDLNVQQYCCAGLNFGSYYDQSPIIAYDGAAHPGYTMGSFTPSTVPGCRTPHLWLGGGRSLYDATGPDHALLRLDPALAVDGLMQAAARRALPLRLIDIDPDAMPEADGHGLILSRPDQHVAWRGRAAPADPLELIDRLRGARAGA
ncbi:FAD-dependent oxidoreductase [Phreatobacter stygius]|uniref:Monooxygenase n=1 Tax=Phreatobacter stygius TaxID=1940610 RepID=A0A4D7BEF5_9HYPH|nr:FAD-dependent oxidoreductase [Phreatobacter stygius]QCI68328.1 monooxygenase [Phreatobacter stygius]